MQGGFRVMLAKYAPAGVLVNEVLQILQFRGDTSPYLANAPGKPGFEFMKMLREGLFLPARSAIQKAKKQNETVRVENVAFHFEGHTRRVHLEVTPLENFKERGFLISFEPVTEGASRPKTPEIQRKQWVPPDLEAAAGEISRLRNELNAAKEYLRTVTEQYEATNEELQAANEEAQSSNEELQSLNEELQTTKEELESINEELLTVNDEMNTRNLELNAINSDLTNVLHGVQMCIVLLDMICAPPCGRC